MGYSEPTGSIFCGQHLPKRSLSSRLAEISSGWKPIIATTLILLALVAGTTCIQAAPCRERLNGYDTTPPAAIRDEIDRHATRFEWATDVDVVNGNTWIWNYIWNKGDNALGPVTWSKGNINTTVWAPIAVGEAHCARRYVTVASSQPDPDAPIIHSTNEQREEAAAYRMVEQAPQTTGSIPGRSGVSVVTTLQDEAGKPFEIEVEVFSYPSKDGIGVYLYFPPRGVILGLSGITSAFSNGEANTATASLGRQQIKFERGTLSSFAGSATAEVITKALPGNVDERLQKDFLFLSGGSGKTIIDLPAYGSREILAELVVFDVNRKPLFINEFSLFVPAPK